MLTKGIAGHDEDIAAWTGDIKVATRGPEKADFDARHKYYSESVDAPERAIDVLKVKATDHAQAPEFFAQLSALKDLDQITCSAEVLQIQPTYHTQPQGRSAEIQLVQPTCISS